MSLNGRIVREFVKNSKSEMCKNVYLRIPFHSTHNSDLNINARSVFFLMNPLPYSAFS